MLLVALVIFISLNIFVFIAAIIAISLHADGLSFERVSSDRQALNVLVQDVRINVPAQAAAYLIGIWSMVLIAQGRYRERFREAIRWRWPQLHWFKYFLAGVGMWVVAAELSRFLPNPGKTLPIEQAFQSTTAAYILAIFGITIAPIVEEMFFRGLLYSALERRVGMTAGIIITALAFALLHSAQLANSWSPLAVLFTVGLVLTIVRARSGSVAASVLLHVGYNGAIFATMYWASDRFRHLERLPH